MQTARKRLSKIEVYDNEKVNHYDMEDGKVTLDLTKPSTQNLLRSIITIIIKCNY